MEEPYDVKKITAAGSFIEIEFSPKPEPLPKLAAWVFPSQKERGHEANLVPATSDGNFLMLKAPAEFHDGDLVIVALEAGAQPILFRVTATAVPAVEVLKGRGLHERAGAIFDLPKRLYDLSGSGSHVRLRVVDVSTGKSFPAELPALGQPLEVVAPKNAVLEFQAYVGEKLVARARATASSSETEVAASEKGVAAQSIEKTASAALEKRAEGAQPGSSSAQDKPPQAATVPAGLTETEKGKRAAAGKGEGAAS